MLINLLQKFKTNLSVSAAKIEQRVVRLEQFQRMIDLTNLEKALPTDRFLGIHKSYLVAIHFIHSVEGNILIIDDTKLPIGQTFKQRVNEILKIS